MCGRYVVISKLKAIEKRFNLLPSPEDLFGPMNNVSVGDYAPVVTNQAPNKLQLLQFGMTPSWAKKKMYLFNARSEGDHNKENDTNYVGAMGIISKPSFRSVIRKKRCLIIVDAFIEGPKKEKLSKPYVVYMKDKQRPFTLAGVWDDWADPETGEVISSFAIITTTANDVLQKIGHHRSPVILKKGDEEMWLSDVPLSEITAMLRPYEDDALNAYPISPSIKNPRDKDMALLQPIGARIFPEYDFEIHQALALQGMGMTTARKRKDEEQPDKNTQGTLF